MALMLTAKKLKVLVSDSVEKITSQQRSWLGVLMPLKLTRNFEGPVVPPSTGEESFLLAWTGETLTKYQFQSQLVVKCQLMLRPWMHQ